MVCHVSPCDKTMQLTEYHVHPPAYANACLFHVSDGDSKFKFSIFKGFWRRKQYSLEQV